MIFENNLERIFEYDIHVSIILFLISIVLGYKKITADGIGITKSPFLIPSMKKTKTWSEIKHMAHVSSWSEGQYGGITCYNILCFIDNHKLPLKLLVFCEVGITPMTIFIFQKYSWKVPVKILDFLERSYPSKHLPEKYDVEQKLN